MQRQAVSANNLININLIIREAVAGLASGYLSFLQWAEYYKI